MFILVTGGSGSGKSEYAEQRVMDMGEGCRIYIATMMCFDEESKKRVERHRKMRSGKGFHTVERYLDLKNLEFSDMIFGVFPEGKGQPGRNTEISDMPGEDAEEYNGQVTVLLECMSNLTANEIFDPRGSHEQAAREIKTGIDRLLGKCDNLVVVTNELFSDGIEYDAETRKYLEVLGEINCYMAKLADEVAEVVYGIPVLHKSKDGSQGLLMAGIGISGENTAVKDSVRE